MDGNNEEEKKLIGSNKFIVIFIKKYIVYSISYSFGISFFTRNNLISVIVSLLFTYFIFVWISNDILKMYELKKEELITAKKKMIIFLFVSNIFITVLDFFIPTIISNIIGGAFHIAFKLYYPTEIYVIQVITDILSYIVIAKLYSDLFDKYFKGIKKSIFFKFAVEVVIVAVISFLLKIIVLKVFI